MVDQRIACIGECLIEIGFPDARHPTGRVGFGGDSFNTAVYLKRAAPEAVVHYVTALGTDAASERMVKVFAAEGLDTTLIERRADRLPGCYAIALDHTGERSFLYWRETSAARTLFELPEDGKLEWLDEMDLIYLSGITVAILAPGARHRLRDYLSRFRSAGGQVAFDSNYRPRLWDSLETARETMSEYWAIADIALPSLDDEINLFGDADAGAVVERLRRAGVRIGALKRGSKGPVAIGEAGIDRDYPTTEYVVDTTAAGDSFNGAFLAATLSGSNLADCMAAGHETALRVIAHPGAILPRDRSEADC